MLQLSVPRKSRFSLQRAERDLTPVFNKHSLNISIFLYAHFTTSCLCAQLHIISRTEKYTIRNPKILHGTIKDRLNLKLSVVYVNREHYEICRLQLLAERNCITNLVKVLHF